MDIRELARAVAQADGETAPEDDVTPLQEEAYVAHLREVYGTYGAPLPEVLRKGDLVVFRPYMGVYRVPNQQRPAVLHEFLPRPMRGYELGQTHELFSTETYDCVLAILHSTDGGATLLFTPANTRRLKRYTPTES